MPEEDNRNSDGASLDWEEFFVSSNSEDLLPCLLGMYDSIAAARKLRDDSAFSANDSERKIDTIFDNAIDEEGAEDRVDRARSTYDVRNDCVRCQSDSESFPSASLSAENPWSRFRDSSSLTRGRSPVKFDKTRPCSPASIASLSSRYSGCSNGSSSDGGSMGTDNDDSNLRRTDDDSNDLANESLDSLVAADNDRTKNAKASSVPQPRTSYTTASQYSEDSGIYSANLVRSESLHERSWFYADGEDFSYTSRVIVEILETEHVYVNDLHQIITGYLDEWRNDCKCALSSEQIYDLFSNIEEIYNFNRCFLWELEQCGLDPVKIARCFVENNANFSIYAAYCTHYPRSISILTELMRQEKTAHIFRERQIRLHHTLPLGSYLLKPVQRILKYHLLLQNMVKHTPPDAIGYNDITVALSTMTGIAHHINTMKRRHEHAVRVQEVQSLLMSWQGPDLTTFGELYAEGAFRISGAKAFRHIFLFEHMLLVTKKKEGGILNYKTHILCSNLMLVECIPKEPLSFQIIPFDNPRLQFSVHARSLEEKRHWTLELKRVILENYNVDIPSHARQLVMELGQIQSSENVSMEKISSPKRQHSAPEYLEKRKLDREKKSSMKSKLIPLFRRLDSLQNYKMRSKLKKNQFLSEGSIFSDTTVNSDESYTNDSGLQNLSKTTEDLSQTCDEMTRTLADLSKTSASSLANPNRACGDSATPAHDTESEECSSYRQKEKLIEEIIGQLLIASQKFQKAIKDHELSVRAKQSSETRTRDCKSDFEEDDTDDEIFGDRRESGREALKYTKESTIISTALNTSSESLSASLNVLMPTPPNVWLKQQAQHLATPQKKADSLPRTFQINAEEEWRANRPKTIASDKPTQMKDKRYNNEELTPNCFLAARKKKELLPSVSISSLNTTNVHPECKFYRTSVARMTFRKMVRTIAIKLLAGHGRSERFYKVEQQDLCKVGSRYTSKQKLRSEDVDAASHTVPTYKQGSSALGARIANARDVPDYADPKVLFPTITPSKKAASVLGIRAYSNVTLSRLDCKVDDVMATASAGDGSDCSADSFYERQFERIESEFENAVRETSILNDTVDVDVVKDVRESFRRYSRVNVNISVHKLIKIPPPVPVKPNMLRGSEPRFQNKPKMTFRSKKNFTMATSETSIPTRGWVKHVVDRFQTSDAEKA